jgi:predicted GTPase
MTSIVNGTELDDLISEKIFVPNANMVLVMGATGAGKSYFVNSLCDTPIAKEGDSLFAGEYDAIGANLGRETLDV